MLFHLNYMWESIKINKAAKINITGLKLQLILKVYSKKKC